VELQENADGPGSAADVDWDDFEFVKVSILIN
jgi:hypothetical protein